jgi:5-oxoprolinase (ATP-hydrolysing) subunit A
MQIDLNCDMGESSNPNPITSDDEIMPLVTSANIACGFHAGNPMVMARTVQLAAQHGISIGAHPSYPDRVGFGRRVLEATPDEVKNDVLYQIGALAAFARANGVALTHVKPHGALYNVAAIRQTIAVAIARAVAAFDPELGLVGLPNSEMEKAARELGLRFIPEGFADRAYNRDGSLRSRREPGSVFDDPRRAAEQALQIVHRRTVTTLEGETIPLDIQTLCVHGDSPAALGVLQAVHEALEKDGAAILPFSNAKKQAQNLSISFPRPPTSI